MGEVSQAFLTAETDQMKIMKLKLVKEANKLKKLKGQLARERSKRKMILKLANQRRKKKRIKKRNKKSHVCKVKSLSLVFNKTKVKCRYVLL